MLATLGLLCAVLYGAVQAFAAHLGASALAPIPRPPKGRRAVSATSPSCRPSARRGSAGRFGSAPRLVGVLFLTLVVGFASAQTCTETCFLASDGVCDDGGPGSIFGMQPRHRLHRLRSSNVAVAATAAATAAVYVSAKF